MKTFTDNTGRNWSVTINVGAVKRVRDACGVNLLDAVGGTLIQQLIDDPVLLADIVYCLVKDQTDAAGITDDQFGRCLAGDAIDAATAAVLEELVDFFPLRRRTILRKALEKAKALEAMGIEAAGRYLDSDLPQRAMQERIDELLASRPNGPSVVSLGPSDPSTASSGLKASGGTSGGSPESSESTPPN
jgi:hypothetical protein